MDRRQRKSRAAIMNAFSRLLEHKRVDSITVQEIIDEADVGRSTFYAHFETKDMLLNEMCKEIFDHIFEGGCCDYSNGKNDMQARLAHILYHLKDRKSDAVGILSAENGELFMRYLRDKIFDVYLSEFTTDVPQDFLSNHLVYSFCAALQWWLNEGMKTPPEEVAAYFMSVTETHK